MFSKGSREKRWGRGGDLPPPPSIISADMHVVGNISSTGEVQVDGSVNGDVRCRTLIIGITGAITGEVDVQDARVHGSMSGQLRAKSVFLASTARMVGDITHESLAIEPGAIINGHCRHTEADSKSDNEEIVPENLRITDATQTAGKNQKSRAITPPRKSPEVGETTAVATASS